MTTKTVSIHFDNEEAAGHFMSWLNGQGEQDYWTWMEAREQEEDGDISVINFDYSWNDFQITAKCGRLS